MGPSSELLSIFDTSEQYKTEAYSVAFFRKFFCNGGVILHFAWQPLIVLQESHPAISNPKYNEERASGIYLGEKN